MWLARDSLCQGKEVAIKVYQRVFQSIKVAQAVATELSIMRQLAKVNHPNIVKVLDFIGHSSDADGPQEEGGVAVVMEYLPMTLEDALAKSPGMFKSQTLITEVMRSLLSAISLLHKLRIIHRDLKPGNILISIEDEWATLGFSKHKEPF